MVFAHATNSTTTEAVVFWSGEVNRLAVALPTLWAIGDLVSLVEVIAVRPLHLHLRVLIKLPFQREVLPL
jgi:hypothetical protein